MIGSRLAHFEITGSLGEGGMGRVYRAVDTKLGREVAIKVLPEVFVSDPERLERFRREARLLATLSHQNIAGIHEVRERDGTLFLVMELAEGGTLADRLERGALPIDEAISVARQIAEALEAAHARGIVHRDLKPSNVMVDDEGRVKVLDFGLAKLSESDPVRPVLSESPTRTYRATEPGTLLGTAAYMSPEQARGQPVDQRGDVWAFGVVLYEMLTGERLFEGRTMSDILAAVLRGELSWDRVPSRTPAGLFRLLRRCLQRDPKQRLHAIADARIELEELSEEGPSSRPVGERERRPSARRSAAVLLVGTVVGLLLGFGLWVAFRPTGPGVRGTIRAFVPPPPGSAFELHPDFPASVAVSPDGTRLVYGARDGSGPTRLWIRPLDSAAATPLEGTEGAANPFWSPDGHSIAFSAGGKLKRVAATGGPVSVIAELTGSRALNGAGAGRSGGSWSEAAGILAADRGLGEIVRIAPGGGRPVPVTELDEEAGETWHGHPRFLPDGERFLYVVSTGDWTVASPQQKLMVGSVSGEEPRELMATDSYAEAAAGHLWFVRDGILMAQPFDPGSAELSGEPKPVGSGAVASVWAEWYAQGYFSVSPRGIVAYHTGPPLSRSILTWYDREGNELGTVGPADYQYQLSLSPSGTRAVVQVADLERVVWSLWVYDLERGTRSRLTRGTAATGVWSPDERQIVYQAKQMYVQSLGFEDARPLREGGIAAYGREGTGIVWPLSWSGDGRHLVYGSTVDGYDLWVLPLDGDGDPWRLQETEAIEEDAALSPDGRWLAYTSDRSGRFEVYLTAFPEGGRTWQVSAEGGIRPEWGPGGELFFLRLDDMLMSTRVIDEDGNPAIGEPRPLFPVAVRHHLLLEPGGYAVSPDGERILVNRVLSQGTPDPIALLVGWPEILDD